MKNNIKKLKGDKFIPFLLVMAKKNLIKKDKTTTKMPDKTTKKVKTSKRLKDTTNVSNIVLTSTEWKKINIEVNELLKWDRMLNKIEKYVDKNRDNTVQQIMERKNMPKKTEYDFKKGKKFINPVRHQYSAKDIRNQKILDKLEKEPIHIKEHSTSELEKWKPVESLEVLYEKLDQQTKNTGKMVRKDAWNRGIFVWFFAVLFFAIVIIMVRNY